MQRSAVPLDPSPASAQRARWIAAFAALALLVLSVALWARYGAAVFVDAFGAVVSCL